MSSVEDLVKVDENENQVEVPEKEKRGRGRPKKEKKETTDPLQPVEGRGDILVSVAVLGQLKDYVGEDIPPAKIRLMTVERLNSLFSVYQAKLGQELTFDTMDGIVSTAVKGLSFFMTFDDNDALKEDLLKNKGLQQILGKKTAGVTEKYGDFIAFGRVFFDIFKHIKFPESEAAPTHQVQADASTVLEDAKKES